MMSMSDENGLCHQILMAGTEFFAEEYDTGIPGVGKIMLRALSHMEVVLWRRRNCESSDPERPEPDEYSNARLIQLCSFCPAGKRIFRAEQVTVIAGILQRYLDPWVDACLEINGMSGRGRERLEKNSMIPGSDSSSGSVRTSESPDPS
jgi:hypothetical protein